MSQECAPMELLNLSVFCDGTVLFSLRLEGRLKLLVIDVLYYLRLPLEFYWLGSRQPPVDATLQRSRSGSRQQERRYTDRRTVGAGGAQVELSQRLG